MDIPEPVQLHPPALIYGCPERKCPWTHHFPAAGPVHERRMRAAFEDHWRRHHGTTPDVDQPSLFAGPSPLTDQSPPLHRDAHDTEMASASRARQRSASQKVRVLLALAAAGATGCTDYELGARLCILRTAAGTRRKMLEDAGLVVDSGRRRRTDTDSPAIVWVLTERGAYEARVLNTVRQAAHIR